MDVMLFNGVWRGLDGSTIPAEEMVPCAACGMPVPKDITVQVGQALVCPEPKWTFTDFGYRMLVPTTNPEPNCAGLVNEGDHIG